jgi:hypothetical protein
MLCLIKKNNNSKIKMARACTYDGQPFEGDVYRVPERVENRRMVLSPLQFCSPSCGKSFLLESNIGSHNMALFSMYYDSLGITNIEPSPPKMWLACYHVDGQGLSVAQYREAQGCAVRKSGIVTNRPPTTTAQENYVPLFIPSIANGELDVVDLEKKMDV